MGHRTEDIIYGLCQALVRNYLSNVGLGKDIRPPIVFQGGVSFNQGIIKAFEEELKEKIIVPPHPEIMGALGAALLVQEKMETSGNPTGFKGMGVSEEQFDVASFECDNCPNRCEIAELKLDGRALARWGGRCDRWENTSID
jgi:hypothetical protein